MASGRPETHEGLLSDCLVSGKPCQTARPYHRSYYYMYYKAKYEISRNDAL